MIRRGALAVAAMLSCAAGPPRPDPDWPCVQRLVPSLTPGTFWTGQPAAGDWGANPAVADLVRRVAPRAVPRDDAVSQLQAFAAGVPVASRPATLSLLFAGLVEETNAQRSQVIARLRDVNQRQRDITATVRRVNQELKGLPPDAPDPQREEVVSRRAFLIRDYQEVERTIRYACEVPGELESRLGAFAQALQPATPSAEH